MFSATGTLTYKLAFSCQMTNVLLNVTKTNIMDVLQKIAIMTTLKELIFEEIQFREFYKF